MPKKPVRSAVCAKFAKAVRTTREQRGYSQQRFCAARGHGPLLLRRDRARRLFPDYERIGETGVGVRENGLCR